MPRWQPSRREAPDRRRRRPCLLTGFAVFWVGSGILGMKGIVCRPLTGPSAEHGCRNEDDHVRSGGHGQYGKGWWNARRRVGDAKSDPDRRHGDGRGDPHSQKGLRRETLSARSRGGQETEEEQRPYCLRRLPSRDADQRQKGDSDHPEPRQPRHMNTRTTQPQTRRQWPRALPCLQWCRRSSGVAPSSACWEMIGHVARKSPLNRAVVGAAA
jgi:hypothetical protein